jgi:hypothetical protein
MAIVHVPVQDDVNKDGIYGLRSGENDKSIFSAGGRNGLAAFFLKKRLSQRQDLCLILNYQGRTVMYGVDGPPTCESFLREEHRSLAPVTPRAPRPSRCRTMWNDRLPDTFRGGAGGA